MAIQWKKVTWYSQVVAIILFVVVFIVGFWLGNMHGKDSVMDAAAGQES